MFETVLIANRGEIARRIIRTCRALNVRSIAVYSDADSDALYVKEADEAIHIGRSAPAESYLDMAKIVAAGTSANASAIHPGYGFLAENPAFARAVQAAGMVWIGPSPEVIELMGDKVNARNLMEEHGIPVAAGTSEPVTDLDQALSAAGRIGYPLMVKASAGGGGIGMAVALDEADLHKVFETTLGRAVRFFGSSSILLERWISSVRHVEVQIVGLPDGQVLALGDRDCSVQRRHQKVVEESPAPLLPTALRDMMHAAAVRIGEAVSYRGVGTIECLVDPATEEFFFLEMNTRLQVEHPVTEQVTGLDLVELQLRVAAGEDVALSVADITTVGHSVECRIYAEDSQRFIPGPGVITRWTEPRGDGIRLDAGYTEGDEVTTFYDPLLAKLCAWGEDRTQALDRMQLALEGLAVEGPKVNLEFLRELLANEEFQRGEYDTRIVERMRRQG